MEFFPQKRSLKEWNWKNAEKSLFPIPFLLYKKKKSSLKEWEVSIVYLEEKVYLCRYKPNKKGGTDGKTNSRNPGTLRERRAAV